MSDYSLYYRNKEGIICVCRDVYESEINKAISGGANTFEEIRKATRAGTGCMWCENKIISLLKKNKLIL